MPLARGTFEISSNHSSENGGFNFEKGVPTPARDPRCDIYLYAKRDAVGLSSPARLSGGLRKTTFTKQNENDVETVKINTGDKLSVDTVYGRAEITINSIDHIGYDAIAIIEYIFYPRSYGK